jgi:hypothetical protein
MKKVTFSSAMFLLLFWACFFPFISLLGLQTDSQPNALIVSLLILLFNSTALFPKSSMLLLLLSVVGLVLLPFSRFDVQNIVSVVGYFSLFIVPIAVYISLHRFGGLSFNLFKIISIVWGFVAIIQKVIYPGFLTFLLPRASGITMNGRGVISLAPEPTYYGTVVALLIVIYLLNFWEEKRAILHFLIFQLVFLSISSTIIFVGLFSFFVYFIVSFFQTKIITKTYLFLGILGVGFLGITVKSAWQETRLFKTIDIFIESPELLLKDESISERFNHIYFSIASLNDNYGVPHGYGRFKNYIIEKNRDPAYYKFFEMIDLDHYSKIMSGYGTIIFEFGVIGLLLPVLLLCLLRKKLRYPNILFAFVFLNVVLFTAISLFNGMVLFVIGNIIFLSRKEETKVDKTIALDS